MIPQFINDEGKRNGKLPAAVAHCVAFNSDSNAAQTSTTQTTTYSDSFNRTQNIVTNTSDSGNVAVTLGDLGQGGEGFGANTVAYLVIGAVLLFAVYKFVK